MALRQKGRRNPGAASPGLARWADTEGANRPAPRPKLISQEKLAGGSSILASAVFWRYAVWLACALAVGGGAIALLYLPADTPSRLGQAEPESKSFEVRGAIDPLASVGVETRSLLMTEEAELPAELKRTFLGDPDSLCQELNALGLTNTGWRQALFHSERFQCASELVNLTTASVDYGPSTLFFLLRGSAEDRIDYLRLKLVVEDPRQKTIGHDAVWLVIDRLAERFGWTVPGIFRRSIADYKPLETQFRGVRLSVAPEDPELTGDPRAVRRLNIIMDFGEPDFIRPADMFEMAPAFTRGVPPISPAAE